MYEFGGYYHCILRTPKPTTCWCTFKAGVGSIILFLYRQIEIYMSFKHFVIHLVWEETSASPIGSVYSLWKI